MARRTLGSRRRLTALVAATGLLPALVAGVLTAGAAPAQALTRADCARGTVVNVVAHEDDDLIFLSPHLQQDLDAGRCVTTVFLTAGDARGTLEGGDTPEAQQYWRDGRETGSLAAYTVMTGAAWGWYEVDAGVPGRSIQAVENSADPRVRLVFLRLKDGMQGDKADPDDNAPDPLINTPVKTLWKAWNGLSDIRSLVDDQHPERAVETYSRQELIDTLGTIYRSTPRLLEINTQDPRPSDLARNTTHYDHPDHVATALFARAARAQYAPRTRLHTYLGYSSDQRPVNVTGTALDRKYAAFQAYADHDDHICGTPTIDIVCPEGLGDWYPQLLRRQIRLT